MSFNSIKTLMKATNKGESTIPNIIMAEDMSENGLSIEDSQNKMMKLWKAMKDSVENYDGTLVSNSGLSGGDGVLFNKYVQDGKSICGDFISQAMYKSISVSESNACMKRIVAAPTAGSCGVIPGVFCAYQDLYHVEDETMVEALYVSAGVGEVIAKRASISGAECGCQAEIGSASAMASCALTYLRGGTEDMIMQAGALSLKNMLGLVCDPVGGYVEVPCVKRNAMGAVNAITSSELALSGIKSIIPFDEVIDAMAEIGQNMHENYKETGKGGLAITPTGIMY